MKTISHLSFFVVILTQLVDGSSISCRGSNCKPEEIVTKAMTANKTSRTAPTTASVTPGKTTVQSTTVPSARIIVCPPGDPFENLFPLFRTSFLKTTNVPTLREKPTKLISPEFLNRLLKISKSHRRRRPTSTPTEGATEVLSTTSRQTTTVH